jgi:hypothetical protein
MTDPHADAKVRITHELATSADALWAILGDFTDLSWVPAVPRCEMDGEGVGMVRHMYLDENFVIDERLEALDDERRTISYSIPQNNPLPVADYLATMTIHERDPQRCELEWSCTWSAPVGVTEDEAVEAVTAFYWDVMPGIELAAGVTRGS